MAVLRWRSRFYVEIIEVFSKTKAVASPVSKKSTVGQEREILVQLIFPRQERGPCTSAGDVGNQRGR